MVLKILFLLAIVVSPVITATSLEVPAIVVEQPHIFSPEDLVNALSIDKTPEAAVALQKWMNL
jgi:hypothetical protein